MPHLFGGDAHGRASLIAPPPRWLTPVANWAAVRRALLGEHDERGRYPLGEPNTIGCEEEGNAGDRHFS
jgi:hypothetical protein